MTHKSKSTVYVQKPDWLKRRLPSGPAFEQIKGMIGRDRLHTVCQEAKCPNIWECFSHKTATFLILGSSCSRNCRFCSVPQGDLQPPDPDEPARVARVAREMGLKYVVVTSVTRDDLAAFHRQYVHPSRMIAAASGSFETESMLHRLEEAFAALRAGCRVDQRGEPASTGQLAPARVLVDVGRQDRVGCDAQNGQKLQPPGAAGAEDQPWGTGLVHGVAWTGKRMTGRASPAASRPPARDWSMPCA